LPNVNFAIPSVSIHILLVGLLTICIDSRTGSLFQYFNPSHNRRDATFSLVISSISSLSALLDGWLRRRCGGGGVGPPRTTVDMKPAFCSARERRRWRFVDGIEVSPSRALEAFWRWEHVCARSTRDILSDSENCTLFVRKRKWAIARPLGAADLAVAASSVFRCSCLSPASRP